MKQLWAPWRMAYVGKDSEPEECVFCLQEKAHQDQERLVLHRGRHCFVVMNKFPYSNGHLLIVPFRHTSELETLCDEERLELFELLIRAQETLKRSFHPQGFNIGINLGKVGGAGVTEHLHIHIVPRWLGDTNFMPVFSDIRVIPQHLEATYKVLRKGFEALE